MWNKTNSLCVVKYLPAAAAAASVSYRGSPENDSPGFPKTWQQRKETKHGRQESQSTKQIMPQPLHNLFKRLTNKVRRVGTVDCVGLDILVSVKIKTSHVFLFSSLLLSYIYVFFTYDVHVSCLRKLISCFSASHVTCFYQDHALVSHWIKTYSPDWWLICWYHQQISVYCRYIGITISLHRC